MEGTIINFRRGRHTQKDNQMVVEAPGYGDKEKALELVGKEVGFKTESGKTISGKVSAVHGNSGAVRVLFEKGMAGQSIGKKVEIE